MNRNTHMSTSSTCRWQSIGSGLFLVFVHMVKIIRKYISYWMRQQYMHIEKKKCRNMCMRDQCIVKCLFTCVFVVATHYLWLRSLRKKKNTHFKSILLSEVISVGSVAFDSSLNDLIFFPHSTISEIKINLFHVNNFCHCVNWIFTFIVNRIPIIGFEVAFN